MRSEDVPEIRELTLFRTMADDAFERLIRGAYFQTFPPTVELIREGDAPDFLHVLVEGSVELLARWHNRETTLSLLAPVSTFILAATIMDRPNLMSARTVAKSRIALIPSEDVRLVFSFDRNFANAIVTELADCFRASIKHAKNIKLRSSVERLANFLICEVDAHGHTTDAGELILPYEKRLIASWLGMTPENLSRAFGSLRPYGVRVESSRVHISDVPSLRRLAKPTPLIDNPMS